MTSSSSTESPAAEGRPQSRPLLVGILIVATFVVLKTLHHVLSGRPSSRVWTALCFFAIEMPVMMVALSASFRWVRRRRVGSLAASMTSLAVAGVIGSLFTMAAWVIVNQVPIGSVSHRITTLQSAAISGFAVGLLHCGVWALAFVYPFAVEESRLGSLRAEKQELEVEKHRLEAQALRLEAAELRSAAELARLRTQLEPHFLLNTLNAVAGLVTQHPDEARRLLVCLGDLFRDALEEAGEMQTLEREITWLRRYAEILEARHSGALTFEWEVSEEARAVMVPRLLLQPLVENAVKHGALQRRSGVGKVAVRASVVGAPGEATKTICTVEDNGPGIIEDPPRSRGLGLRAVRRRLELECTDATLRLVSSSEGTKSIVELGSRA